MNERVNPLSANPIKWPNTLFDHFVGLSLKGLTLNAFNTLILCFYCSTCNYPVTEKKYLISSSEVSSLIDRNHYYLYKENLRLVKMLIKSS